MDEWSEPGTAAPQEWLPPDSLRLPQPESSARHSSPADALPEYSQPLAYSQPGPYGPPPSHGEHPTLIRPTPYGQSPYGRPSAHHDYPLGGPGLPPWVPSHPVRRRSRVKTLLAIGGGLVACLVALALVFGVVQRVRTDGLSLTGGHRLTLPDRSAGYVRINTPVALDLGKALADQVKSAGPMWAKPVVGIYSVSAAGSPGMVFIGGDSASNPKLRGQLKSSSSLNVAIDSFLSGAHVAQSSDFPAGKFGGLLRCGLINGTEATCVWVDHSTFGSLVLLHPPALSDAADIALVFRNATEH
ncbi:MAG TPA: hypothetical protein VH298_02025 [Jatrophihabitans sp.]|nr:hypothetical protein [Jatrophihabitans sp.]